MNQLTLITSLTLLILTLGEAQGAPASKLSFSCSKAHTQVEKMICQDPALTELDSKLGTSYSALMELSGRDAKYVKEQRSWLKERNKCRSPECIKKQTEQRLSEVEELIQQKTAAKSTSAGSSTEEFAKEKSRLMKEGALKLQSQHGAELADVDLSESSFDCYPNLAGWDCSAYYQGCASTDEGGRCCSQVSFEVKKEKKGFSIGNTSVLSLENACKDQ
ncbi:MAG: lysozyme inhibitor LprI family protein [Bdellovibrionia bacterium]